MVEAALQELLRVVAEAKRSDPMAPVTVIVPSNLAGRTVGWRLAGGLGAGAGVAGVRITTLARLAESVAAGRLHPRRPLLPSILAAAWRAELAAAQASIESWAFAEVWDHPSTVAALVRAYRDLREVGDPDLPEAAAGSVPAETIRLSQLVRGRLAAGWYDQQDLYATASELAVSSPSVFAESGALVRYLEGEEPPSALAFLGALERALGVVTVRERPFETRPLVTTSGTVPSSTAVVSTSSTDVGSGAVIADRVLHASDSDDEVRLVVREVVAALAGEQRARRLAILYSRPDPYVRLIHAQLRAAGIEHNGRGGIAVAELACARAFLGMLDLRRRGYPRPRVFDVLSTWPVRRFGTGGPVPVLGWERISREAHIAGGEALYPGWIRRLDDFDTHQQARLADDDESWQRERRQRTIDDTRALSAFVTALDARLTALDEAPSWASVSEQCLSLLAEAFGSVDDILAWEHDDKRAYVTLRSALHDLRSLDAYGTPSGIPGLLDVLTTQLEAAVPRTGKFGQGVFVGPIAQGRGLDLDQVWVVGLAEDLYPGTQQEDALLPDDLRAATPGLLSAHDRVERMQRDLAAAFASATTVTASFPRGDLRASAERLPSRLLLPSLRRLTGNAGLAATEWFGALPAGAVVDSPSFAGSITTTPVPATDQEWSVRLVAATAELDDPVFTAARQLRFARLGSDFTRFDGNLSGLDALPDLRLGRRISPTALESYAACPFSYFVKRLLRVEPVEEPVATGRISPLDLGNIFHYTFDRFLNAEKAAGTLPGPGQPWRAEHHDRLLATAELVITEHEAAGRLGHATLWGFEGPAVLRSLGRMLIDDSAWRARNNSAPVAAELTFGFSDDPPVQIEVDGGEVSFVGSADKVDLAGSTVYITDIKSGSRSRFTKIASGADPTVGGTKLQLPIYAKAAQRAYPAGAAEARYWFIHGRDAGKEVAVALTPELEQRFSQVVGTLVTGIARGQFFKKPSKTPGFRWVDCEYCTPGGAGHETIRRGYERKRAHPGLLDLLSVIDPEGADAVRQEAAESAMPASADPTETAPVQPALPGQPGLDPGSQDATRQGVPV